MKGYNNKISRLRTWNIKLLTSREHKVTKEVTYKDLEICYLKANFG